MALVTCFVWRTTRLVCDGTLGGSETLPKRGFLPLFYNRTLLSSPYVLGGGVEAFVLLLSGLGGRYSVLGHSCHSLGVLEPPPELAVVGLNLCSLALGYHLLVDLDDAGYLLGVFADLVGEGSALND